MKGNVCHLFYTKNLNVGDKICNIMLWGCYVMYAFKNIDQK